MKIFLTGSTGFLGNNLARQLLDDGHQLTVSVRRTSDRRPLEGLQLKVRELDLKNPANLNTAIQGSDVVIHSAAMIQIGWTHLSSSRAINVEGTQMLAEAARNQAARMVLVSTVDTLAAGEQGQASNENNINPQKSGCSYVVSKREAESVFFSEIDKGLDGVIVNPGFMLGPWDWKPSSGQMMLTLANRSLPFAPSGGCSAVDVRDVVSGITAAITEGRTGHRYILAGENISYLDLWRRMAETIGTSPPRAKLPRFVESTVGVVGDIAGKFLGSEPQLNSAATEIGSLLNWYSSDKAIAELDYRVNGLDAAISDAWAWFKQFGYA